MYFQNEPSASHDFFDQKHLKKNPQKCTPETCFFHVLQLYFHVFQNEPSANPLRLLVNSRVGGPMLVNLKTFPKHHPY